MRATFEAYREHIIKKRLAQIAVALEHSDPEVRYQAIYQLGHIDSPACLPLLGQALSDPVAEIRAAALEALPDGEAEAILPQMRAALRDSDQGVRRTGVRALYGLPPAQALPLLSAALQDSDETIRCDAAEILALQQPSEIALPLLRQAWPDASIAVSRMLLSLLGETGRAEALPILEQGLAHPDARTRQIAANAHDECQDLIALQAKYPQASMDEIRERWQTLEDWEYDDDDSGTDDTAAEAPLPHDSEQPESDPEPAQTATATKSVDDNGEAGGFAPQTNTATPNPAHADESTTAEEWEEIETRPRLDVSANQWADLLQSLQDPEREIRLKAAYYIGLTGRPEGLAPLRHSLRHDSSSRVRAMAAEALGHLGQREALPDLIAAYEQERDDVRGNALYGLGLLGGEEVIPFLTEATLDVDKLLASTAYTLLGDLSAEIPLEAFFRQQLAQAEAA